MAKSGPVKRPLLDLTVLPRPVPAGGKGLLSTSYVVGLPTEYEVWFHGADNSLAIVAGRNVRIDTGCTYCAIPHAIWSTWDLALEDPCVEHPHAPIGYLPVDAGHVRVAIWRRERQTGAIARIWPPPGSSQDRILVKACLLRKPKRYGILGAGLKGMSDAAREQLKKDHATTLVGLGVFKDMRICLRLDGAAAKGGVCDLTSLKCLGCL
jgi:hypothetical protein